MSSGAARGGQGSFGRGIVNWQLVIGLILLAPFAVLVVTGWVKWTLYAWRVRGGRSIIDEIGSGRDHWIIWLVVHGAISAFVGACLLLQAGQR